MRNITNNNLFLFIILVSASCNNNTGEKLDRKSYISETKEWHKNRIERLASSDGWLTLAGLYWLKEGGQSFGSARNNDIIFPKEFPFEHTGWFYMIGDSLSVRIKGNIPVYHDSTLVSSLILKSDKTGEPHILNTGSYSWYIVWRNGKYAVRLKDSESKVLKDFKGIETWPADPAWRIEAEFVAYDPPKEILVPNVLGTMDKELCPGILVFNIDGQEFSLEPIGGHVPEVLFIVFSDETTSVETYGGGRFLSVDMPEEGKKTIIDFNRATNPPCAFTEYATCPLPPEQNHIGMKITAGEKMYEESGH